jgi:hypothetical protein
MVIVKARTELKNCETAEMFLAKKLASSGDWLDDVEAEFEVLVDSEMKPAGEVTDVGVFVGADDEPTGAVGVLLNTSAATTAITVTANTTRPRAVFIVS